MSVERAEDVECGCYGCEIERQRSGIRSPDRAAEPCDPLNACAGNGQCWIHSEWIDEAKCDPPGACASRGRCGIHGGEETKGRP